MEVRALDILVAFVLVSAFLVLKNRAKMPRRPPGPPGLPLIGNLLNLPKDRSWLAYQKWGNEYGTDVVHVNLLGTEVVVLNSLQAAKDLLDKRSSIYSDRPYSVMLHKLMGWGRNIGFMQYGDTWRAHRRSFHQCFHERAVDKYQPFINRRVHTLLRLLLDEPESFIKHIRSSSGALLLELAYGIEIEDKEHPYIEVAERAAVGASQAANSGGFLVDLVHILQYLPSWLPGCDFKRQAAKWGQATADTFNIPWDDAKQRISAGAYKPSLASLLLARAGDGFDDFQETVIRNVVGIAFAAGEDTTTATLATFLLAMLLNRDVQIAAQKEIDSVCTLGKLPTFADKEALPFVTAVMLETLRWHPATPLGVSHQAIAHDEYRGYFISSGTIVTANTWAILHDPGLYPDPDIFNPWRFLDSTGQLREGLVFPEAAFGFGILASFDIEKPIDSDGNVIEPNAEFSSGLISYPLPFKADFKPRSATIAERIRSSPVEQDEVFL